MYIRHTHEFWFKVKMTSCVWPTVWYKHAISGICDGSVGGWQVMVQWWSILVKCKLTCRIYKKTGLNWHLYDSGDVMRVLAAQHIEEIEFLYELISSSETPIISEQRILVKWTSGLIGINYSDSGKRKYIGFISVNIAIWGLNKNCMLNWIRWD